MRNPALRLAGAIRYRRLLRRMAGPALLRAFAERYPQAFFVEIGSNDGDQHDHLRPFILSGSWRGVMVEPVPYVFERLRENYGSFERVALENSAIAGSDGHLPFFHMAQAEEDESLPSWYDAIGSFSREAVLSHARHIPDVEDRLVQVDVPCLSFDSLCRKHSVDHVDLLLIDTEGHDWAILSGVDLGAHAPRLVVYEHYHLSPHDRAEALAHLSASGYQTMEEGFDTFCLRSGLDDDLDRVWRELRPAVPGVSAHDERG